MLVDSRRVQDNKSRPSLKARQHALRHCEQERKVVYMFSKKTSYELFLECEQGANLIKLYESLGATNNLLTKSQLLRK